MTQASGVSHCLASFTLNFGPHKQLPYKNKVLSDVYVVTTGGLGAIGVAKAERFGNVIEFTLRKPLCANGSASIANTTYFIGLTATAAPMHVNARVTATGPTPIFLVDARVPTHSVPADPPGGL